MFSNKKNHLKNSPSRNSPPKIHIKKFTPESGLKNSRCTSAGPFCWQTRVFSLFSPGLSLGQTRWKSLGQSRGRRAAQKVYVKNFYVPCRSRICFTNQEYPQYCWEFRDQNWVLVRHSSVAAPQHSNVCMHLQLLHCRWAGLSHWTWPRCCLLAGSGGMPSLAGVLRGNTIRGNRPERFWEGKWHSERVSERVSEREGFRGF